MVGHWLLLASGSLRLARECVAWTWQADAAARGGGASASPNVVCTHGAVTAQAADAGPSHRGSSGGHNDSDSGSDSGSGSGSDNGSDSGSDSDSDNDGDGGSGDSDSSGKRGAVDPWSWRADCLLDFGDALYGDCLWDFIALHVSLLRCDVARFYSFLDGYSAARTTLPEGLDRAGLPYRMLCLMLLHPVNGFSTARQWVGDAIATAATLADVQRVLWAPPAQ